MYRRIVRTIVIIAVLCGGIGVATSEPVTDFVFAEENHQVEHVQGSNNQTSAEPSAEVADIVATVLSYVETEREDDPLIEWDTNIWVKKSNVHGVEYDGGTYYYSLVPHMSYDPLAVEAVTVDDITVIYEEDGAFPILIYTIQD